MKYKNHFRYIFTIWSLILFHSIVNGQIHFSSTPIDSTNQGNNYSYNFTTSNINGTPVITHSILPDWLNFSMNTDSTGYLSGIPTQADIDTFSITLYASDDSNETSQTFDLIVYNVNDTPSFSSTEITTATEGLMYSYNITTEDLDNDSRTISSSLLPVWLTLEDNNNGTAILYGIPLDNHVGNNHVVLNVSDGSLSSNQDFHINVEANTPPSFLTTAVNEATQDIEYAYNISVSDINGNEVTLSCSTLYDWLSFSDNGYGTAILSGIPNATQVNNYLISIIASDGIDKTTQTFTLSVNNVNDTPVFQSSPITLATEDFLYQYKIEASDLDDDSLHFSAITIPSWLNLTDSLNGKATLWGTPENNNVGTFPVQISVFDGITTINQSFNITVENTNDAPVIYINQSIFLSFTENDTAKTLFSDFTIEDVDNTAITSATISFTNSSYSQTEDIINFTNQSSISGSWNSLTGVLTLTGNATQLAYQQAIRSITFENTSENPSILTKYVDITVSDGIDQSNQVIKTIQITPVNDIPVTTDFNISTAESTSIDIELLNYVSDAENSLNLNSIIVNPTPSNGSVSINHTNAIITYTPNGGYSGIDSFTYIICDNLNACGNGTIKVNISNETPVLINDTAETNEDTPVKIDVLHNDTDLQNNINKATLTITTQPLHGKAEVLTTENVILYTPDLNYNGNDKFSYSVCDETSYCDEAQVSIQINPINDKPNAINDNIFTGENTSINITVLNNDNDSNDALGGIDASSLNIVTFPQNGSVIILPNYTINYTPYFGFYGNDTIKYSISDIGYPIPTLKDTAFVFIEVSRKSPVAINDTAQTNEDTQLNIPVINNDYDSGNDINPSTVTITTPPKNGTVLSTSGGIISYLPSQNFFGSDSLIYYVKDYTGLASNKATVHIFVKPVNDPPVTYNASYNTSEDSSLVIPFSDITSDPENNISFETFTISSNPENGSVSTIIGLKSIIYSPNAGFSGNDQFSFIIADTNGLTSNISTISVFVSNEAPTAKDDSIKTQEDTLILFNVTTNDKDPQNNLDTTSVQIIIPPANGIAIVNKLNGLIEYTPNENFFGTDIFEYIVYDKDGYNDRAKVTIIIQPINDYTFAINDTIAANEDNTLKINILDNDFDIDGFINISSLSIIENTKNGTCTVDSISGNIVYVPDFNFFGYDSLIYKICDDSAACATAKVLIEIIAVNDPPIANNDIAQVISKQSKIIDVLKNDTDADNNIDTTSLRIITAPLHGIVQIVSGGKLQFTSNNGYSGIDFIEYEICDYNNSCDIARVNINIMLENIAPNAITDFFTIYEDQQSIFDVLANDYDQNDNIDTTSLQIITPPTNGHATEYTNGTITYRPNANFFGSDQIIYSICDNYTNSLCDQDTVFITILPVNDQPFANNDNEQVFDGEESRFLISENDYDIESTDTLTYKLANYPDYGLTIYNLSNTGEFIITPASGSYCNDLFFKYIVCDQTNSCDTADILIYVNPKDSDNDGIPDFIENKNIDTDSDSIHDYLDTDSDNDNIPDSIESGIKNICNDLPLDTDGDNIPDYIDTDSDNDNKPDLEEGINDCDNDGLLNYIDNNDNCDLNNIPNTFSPNNDGVNDFFIIPIIKNTKEYPKNEIIIFNRWGSEVYKMTNYDNRWNGRASNSAFGSDILPEGTYFYILKLRKKDNNEIIINGTLYLKH
ncbi:MAG: tandem-95 repeat protein [Marinilabiliaceae bacterium]|nr:tandem-95 repeat protein [Marinilabiliaceae bacterium]